MKFCLDSSSLLHFWHEAYPQETFPSLYDKLKLLNGGVILLEPIMKEVKEEEELVSG